MTVVSYLLAPKNKQSHRVYHIVSMELVFANIQYIKQDNNLVVVHPIFFWETLAVIYPKSIS